MRSLHIVADISERIKMKPKKTDFLRGLWHGVPIALGYLSVSFGFGIMAIRAGLSAAAAVGISMTNLTSAGQAAGVAVISAGGGIIEMILTQLVINLRYALMGISLSQKLDGSWNVLHRICASFGITDEIFAVASSARGEISPYYMYGLTVMPFVGWSTGTLLGAISGKLLPQTISSAMGIVLYGMFIAIIVPASREKHSVFFAALIAAGISVCFKYLVPSVSSGFTVIIASIVAAAVMALIAPVEDTAENTNANEVSES